MSDERRYRVLLVTADCDGEDLSEAYNAYRWVTELARLCDVTLLTGYNYGRRPPSEQVGGARVIEWERPRWFNRVERFNAIAKPGYIPFYFKARRWIAELLDAGERFDVFHQITPNALRVPSVCHGFSVPYIVGPKAGSLPTPAGFVSETGSAPWYVRLRSLDHARFRHDPVLRQSYAQAAVVLGAAPYVGRLLSPIALQRFEVEFDAGIDEIEPVRRLRKGPILGRPTRLLHVGRAVRTKGLRDIVRAISRVGNRADVVLTVAGDGEELAICRREAEALEVAHRITFLGRIPRTDVDQLYSEADIFVYPSFREPGGGVVLEAMRHGLPIITTDIGGPGYLVNDQSGIRVQAYDPDQLAQDLANAIVYLSNEPPTRIKMGNAARSRVADVALWKNKVARVTRVYGELAAGSAACGRLSASQ